MQVLRPRMAGSVAAAHLPARPLRPDLFPLPFAEVDEPTPAGTAAAAAPSSRLLSVHAVCPLPSSRVPKLFSSPSLAFLRGGSAAAGKGGDAASCS
jgi:hypothetical protein